MTEYFIPSTLTSLETLVGINGFLSHTPFFQSTGELAMFSLQLLNNVYQQNSEVGPIIKIKKNNTSQIYDLFYFNNDLTENADGSGFSLKKYLSTTSGKNLISLIKWYDQTGNGQHMSTASPLNYPNITLDVNNNFQVDFSVNQPSFLNISDNQATGPIPSFTSSTGYTVICQYNTLTPDGGICSYGLNGNDNPDNPSQSTVNNFFVDTNNNFENDLLYTSVSEGYKPLPNAVSYNFPADVQSGGNLYNKYQASDFTNNKYLIYKNSNEYLPNSTTPYINTNTAVLNYINSVAGPYNLTKDLYQPSQYNFIIYTYNGGTTPSNGTLNIYNAITTSGNIDVQLIFSHSITKNISINNYINYHIIGSYINKGVYKIIGNTTGTGQLYNLITFNKELSLNDLGSYLGKLVAKNDTLYFTKPVIVQLADQVYNGNTNTTVNVFNSSAGSEVLKWFYIPTISGITLSATALANQPARFTISSSVNYLPKTLITVYAINPLNIYSSLMSFNLTLYTAPIINSISDQILVGIQPFTISVSISNYGIAGPVTWSFTPAISGVTLTQNNNQSALFTITNNNIPLTQISLIATNTLMTVSQPLVFNLSTSIGKPIINPITDKTYTGGGPFTFGVSISNYINSGPVTWSYTPPITGLTLTQNDNQSALFTAYSSTSNTLINVRATNTVSNTSLPVSFNLAVTITLPPLQTTSLMGAFSLKQVLSTYTGPVVNITKTSSSTSGTDFYAPTTGDLNTSVNGTGTSLTTFLSGNPGYVTKWYDQSGNGCHMSCDSASLQPRITKDTSNKYQIDFSQNTSSYLNISANPSFGPVPWDKTRGYTVIAHYNTISGYAGGICGCGINGYSTTNNFRRNGNVYQNYWYATDVNGGTYNQNNTVTFTYNVTTTLRKIYDNINTSPTVTQNSTGWNLTTSTNQMIGKTTADMTAGGANNGSGQIYSLFTYNSELSDSARLNIINNYA